MNAGDDEAEAALLDVWVRFKEGGEGSLRKRLILHYSPLVRYVAGRMHVEPFPNIERDELVACGYFGLVDAIEKWDLAREIKFKTYAVSRIRGAILDEYGD